MSEVGTTQHNTSCHLTLVLHTQLCSDVQVAVQHDRAPAIRIDYCRLFFLADDQCQHSVANITITTNYGMAGNESETRTAGFQNYGPDRLVFKVRLANAHLRGLVARCMAASVQPFGHNAAVGTVHGIAIHHHLMTMTLFAPVCRSPASTGLWTQPMGQQSCCSSRRTQPALTRRPSLLVTTSTPSQTRRTSAAQPTTLVHLSRAVSGVGLEFAHVLRATACI